MPVKSLGEWCYVCRSGPSPHNGGECGSLSKSGQVPGFGIFRWYQSGLKPATVSAECFHELLSTRESAGRRRAACRISKKGQPSLARGVSQNAFAALCANLLARTHFCGVLDPCQRLPPEGGLLFFLLSAASAEALTISTFFCLQFHPIISLNGVKGLFD
jgi:hypothetical protein